MRSRILFLAVVAFSGGALAIVSCKEDIVYQPELSFRKLQGRVTGFDCAEPPGRLTLIINALNGVPGALVQLLNSRRDAGPDNGGAPVMEQPPPHVAERLQPRCGGSGKACIVIDAIKVPSGTGCFANEIVEACGDAGCASLPKFRVTREVTLSPTELSSDPVLAISKEIEKLKGERIWETVPTDPILLRVVVTGQPCSSVGPTTDFACDQLVGCVASCPVVLPTLEGKVALNLNFGLLGFDPMDPAARAVQDEYCEPAMIGCATTPVGRPSKCKTPVPPPTCR